MTICCNRDQQVMPASLVPPLLVCTFLHLLAAAGTRYVSGAVVRVLRSYPGQYVVHVLAADGTSQVG